MGFPPPPGVRLERPLPLPIPSLGNEPSMLAFAFGRCQCSVDCATVPSLHESKSPLQGPCTFGLSPKFSTPVEKTVEIHRICWLAKRHRRTTRRRNEPLGPDSFPCRNKGKSTQLLHVVQADQLRGRGWLGDYRSRTERTVQGLADEALFRRHQRSARRGPQGRAGRQFRRGSSRRFSWHLVQRRRSRDLGPCGAN